MTFKIRTSKNVLNSFHASIERIPIILWIVLLSMTIYKLTPVQPIATLQYPLNQQSPSLLGLEYRNDPTVQLIYTIAKSVLDKEVQREEATVDVLINVCRRTSEQFKRIMQAAESDGPNSTHVKQYANDRLLYNQTCLHRYTGQGLQPSIMPEPPLLPSGVDVSTLTNIQSPTNILHEIKPPGLEYTNFESVERYIQNRKARKKRMLWEECYKDGSNAGYFKTYAKA